MENNDIWYVTGMRRDTAVLAKTNRNGAETKMREDRNEVDENRMRHGINK